MDNVTIMKKFLSGDKDEINEAIYAIVNGANKELDGILDSKAVTRGVERIKDSLSSFFIYQRVFIDVLNYIENADELNEVIDIDKIIPTAEKVAKSIVNDYDYNTDITYESNIEELVEAFVKDGK